MAGRRCKFTTEQDIRLLFHGVFVIILWRAGVVKHSPVFLRSKALFLCRGINVLPVLFRAKSVSVSEKSVRLLRFNILSLRKCTFLL